MKTLLSLVLLTISINADAITFGRAPMIARTPFMAKSPSVRPSISPRKSVDNRAGGVVPAIVIPAAIGLKQKCQKDDKRDHCQKKEQ